MRPVVGDWSRQYPTLKPTISRSKCSRPQPTARSAAARTFTPTPPAPKQYGVSKLGYPRFLLAAASRRDSSSARYDSVTRPHSRQIQTWLLNRPGNGGGS